MNPIKTWMKTATRKEWSSLARLARTSVGQLHQLKGKHRKASADLAIRLERAAQAMHAQNALLPLLPRERLAAACRSCEFVKRCRD